MSADRPQGPDPGLCRTCRHGRVQGTARGSLFWRCARADDDPAWPRYPRLPVMRCGGFAAGPAPGTEPSGGG